MSGYGYGQVSPTAFVAFLTTLGQGPWAQITPPTAGAGLAHAPWITVQKEQLRASVEGLAQAMSLAGQEVAEADARWDAAQRQLHFALATAESSFDPQERQAAQRLRVTLLDRQQTAQTSLSYPDEVQFAHKLLDLAQREEARADLQALNLQPRVEQIRATTETLQAAIERQGQARGVSISQAKSRCVGAFNAVHDQMEELLPSLAGDERALLEGCLQSLRALLG